MQPDLTAEKIAQKIQDKIKVLRAPTVLSQWQFKMVDPKAVPQEQPDAGWQTVPIPHFWSSADGEGWFRLGFNPPSEIEGIAIAGSKIDFELFLPIGAAIFLDGKEMYREASWTDTRGVRVVLIESFKEGASINLELHCNLSGSRIINCTCFPFTFIILEVTDLRSPLTTTHRKSIKI